MNKYDFLLKQAKIGQGKRLHQLKKKKNTIKLANLPTTISVVQKLFTQQYVHLVWVLIIENSLLGFMLDRKYNPVNILKICKFCKQIIFRYLTINSFLNWSLNHFLRNISISINQLLLHTSEKKGQSLFLFISAINEMNKSTKRL